MNKRVLSIQSHVAYGYVGGKAAVFPLQSLGFDVDVVNTVNFSNHSGYGRFGGSKATTQELSEIFNLMEANGLLSQSRLLTGYIPGVEALSVIAERVKKLKSSKPGLIYLLDPVLGDSGKLYVAAEVVPIYRDLLPHATIITPNWFEVETLTGVKLGDTKSLRSALRILHEKYRVPHVVISSMPLPDALAKQLPLSSQPAANEELNEDNGGYLVTISSSYAGGHGEQKSGQISTVHSHSFLSIKGYFSGVGDLFSALVLAHFEPECTNPSCNSTSLSTAVTLALSKTVAMVRLTHTLSEQEIPEEDKSPTDEEKDRVDPDRRIRRMRGRELRIIEGRELLRGDDSGVPVLSMQLWEDFWTRS